MFKSSKLPIVVEFFLMFFKDKPIDWLLDYLLAVKVCNPEKDSVSNIVQLKVENPGKQILGILCLMFIL